MIKTLMGDNAFEIKLELDKQIETFLTTESDLALERIDAEESKLDDIKEAVASVPFLSTKKMVVLSNGSANKQIAENIEQLISAVAPTTDLILHEPNIDKRSSYYKYLKANTDCDEYKNLEDRQLPAWLVESATTMGGKISQSDANYLIDRVGHNQMMLFNELNKLVIYSKDISREGIDLLTEKTPQSKIFDLIDAAFSGNKQKALDLYEDQRAQKVEPQAIMALITWQLNVLAYAKFGKNKTVDEVSKDSGISTYPLSKAQRLAGKLDENKLDGLLSEALRIDYKSKTSSLSLDEALKNFIVAI